MKMNNKKLWLAGILIKLVPQPKLKKAVKQIYLFANQKQQLLNKEMMIKGVLLGHSDDIRAITRVTFDIIRKFEEVEK